MFWNLWLCFWYPDYYQRQVIKVYPKARVNTIPPYCFGPTYRIETQDRLLSDYFSNAEDAWHDAYFRLVLVRKGGKRAQDEEFVKKRYPRALFRDGRIVTESVENELTALSSLIIASCVEEQHAIAWADAAEKISLD